MGPAWYLLLLMCIGFQISYGKQQWLVKVFLGNHEHSGSLDTLYMDIDGTESSYRNISLGNNFAVGEIRRMLLKRELGKVNNIRLYQTGVDGIRVQTVTMEDGNGRVYTFPCNCWIQTDQPADDSKPSWLLSSQDCYWDDPQTHCLTLSRITCQSGMCDECVEGYHLDGGVCRGDRWTVTVVVDNMNYAESVDTAYLDVMGTASNAFNISLGNDFKVGETRRRIFERNLGKINNIRLYQGGEDGIRVTKVIMEDERGRVYNFVCNCWVQTDQPADDSKPSWILKSEDCYWNDPLPHCALVERVTCQNGKCDECMEGYHLDEGVCRDEMWTVTVYVDSIDHSGSTDTLYMDVGATVSDAPRLSLGDNFVVGETRRRVFQGNFGSLRYIRLFQTGVDGIRVRKVTLENGRDPLDTVTCNCWIQTDQPAIDSKPSWLLPISNKELWTLTLYIDNVDHADSSGTLYMDLNSTLSNSNISLGNNFRVGETRQRVYRRNWGKINSVRLFQLGEDGLRVRKMTLANEGGRVYTFTCNCWVQTDQPADDSKPSWLLQSEECYWNDPIPYCATVTQRTCQTGSCSECMPGYHLDTGVCRGKQWTVTVSIADQAQAGSFDTLLMDVEGTKSSVRKVSLGNYFLVGETRRSAFEGDIGKVEHIRLYLTGNDGIKIQKVTLEDENGRLFNFLCDCWIQTDATADMTLYTEDCYWNASIANCASTARATCQTGRCDVCMEGYHLDGGVCRDTQWTVTVAIGTRDNAGSLDDLYMDVIGTLSTYTNISLGRNFVLGETRVGIFEKNFGKIKYINLHQSGEDGVLVEEVTMDDNDGRQYTFACNCWIQTDQPADDSKPFWMILSENCYWDAIPNCATVERVGCHTYRCNVCMEGYHLDGGVCRGELWTITVYVDEMDHSDSIDTIYMDVTGTISIVSNISLGNSFKIGETRQIIYEGAVGKVTSIRLHQSGVDGVRLRLVTMVDESHRIYMFFCNCWIQTDQQADDSKPSWLLPSENCHWNEPISSCDTIRRVTCQTGRCDECLEGYHLDGGVCRDKLWTIKVFIDTVDYSGSLDTLFMDVTGTISNASKINLGNNIAVGETRQVTYEGNFGTLTYIRLFQTGEDGIRVRTVTMEDEDNHVYTFTCNCWIQTDQPADDSKPSWLLQHQDCTWNYPIPHCASITRVTCQIGRCDECVEGYHLDGGVCRDERWAISVYIGTEEHSDSLGTIYMDIGGTLSDAPNIRLGNNFAIGEVRQMVYEGALGQLNYIKLYQTGNDGLRLQKVTMQDEYGHLYTFTCNCWIQTDQPADDSKALWHLEYENCSWDDPIPNCATVSRVTCHTGRCDECLKGFHLDEGVCRVDLWTVTVVLDTHSASGSVDTLYMDVEGTVANISALSLGRDFTVGETRRRVYEQRTDLGKINHIRLYQTGEDGIRVKTVVIEDQNGRQYTFTCNCWIQTDQPADDSKPSWLLHSENCYWADPILNCAVVSRVTCQIGQCSKCLAGYHIDNGVCTAEPWTLKLYIDNIDYSGSLDNLYMDVIGTLYNSSEINLGANFIPGETRQLRFDRDFGKVTHIRLYQPGLDGMRVTNVTLYDGHGRQYTFTCNCWIQTDQPADDSKPSWLLSTENCYWKDAIRNCANVARTTCQIGRCIKCMEGYHLDGRVCTGDQWTISVYIATMDNSGSHDALYMDVGSTGSNITEISLGNDFVKGETRQRMYERNFGVINQIRLYQTGDDGIRVRKVTMEDIYGRVYTFVCNCWIQTDQPADDSKASWILQPEMV